MEFGCSGDGGGGGDGPGGIQGGTPAPPSGGGYGGNGGTASNTPEFNPNFDADNATDAEIEEQFRLMEIGLSDSEKILLGYGTPAFNANLRKYHKDARQATLEARDRYGYDEAVKNCCGIGNSFKHALFAALHCQTFGRELGRNLATAHEDVDGGLSKDMDMHNNNEGWKIYDDSPNSSLGAFSNAVKEAVNFGKMKHIRDG